MFDAAKLHAVSGVSASPAAGGGEGFASEEVRRPAATDFSGWAQCRSLTRVGAPAVPDLRHVQGGHRGPGPETGGEGEGGYRLRNHRRPEEQKMDVLHGPEKRRRQGGRGEGQEGTKPLRCSRLHTHRVSASQQAAAFCRPPDARHSVRATSADAAVAFGPALGPLPCAYRRI